MVNAKNSTDQNNLANVQTTEEPKTDLGTYGVTPHRLSLAQMTGTGGGTEFLEVTDSDFSTIVHVAMPIVIKDRPILTSLLRDRITILREQQAISAPILKKQAQFGNELQRMIAEMNSGTESVEPTEEERSALADEMEKKRIAEIEEQDRIEEKLQNLRIEEISILLKIAYLCFRRTDPSLKGKTEAEAVELLGEWMTESQLDMIPEVARGLNNYPTVGAQGKSNPAAL
jgi:hypothetical protein